MLDLSTTDPSTLQASLELDVLVAEWMGWERQTSWWVSQTNCFTRRLDDWSPSTNPAHALEALMARKEWFGFTCSQAFVRVVLHIGTRRFVSTASCRKHSQKDAFCLATCRAIVAALKAEAAKA